MSRLVDLIHQKMLEKYSADQPRDPAGTPTGGQWTSGGSIIGSTDFNPGKIVNELGLGGGVCDSRLIAYENDGQGVWKAISDHKGRHDGNSEVAAYELSEELGWNIVPETVYAKDFAGNKGTVQEFMPGARDGYKFNKDFDDSGLSGKQYKDHVRGLHPDNDLRIQQTVVFDAIIGNDDRNYGNWLIDKDGKFWAIDHGHTSWTNIQASWVLFGHNRTMFMPRVEGGYGVNEQIRQSLNGISRERFYSIVGKVRTPGSADSAWQRLEKIRDTGVIPAYSSSRPTW